MVYIYIYASIWGILMVNVTIYIYGIHGSYGIFMFVYLAGLFIYVLSLKNIYMYIHELVRLVL